MSDENEKKPFNTEMGLIALVVILGLAAAWLLSGDDSIIGSFLKKPPSGLDLGGL